MELRQLKYFLAAATHLNFTKAADACCIVQSAMSQQITALEKELDVLLFERTNRGLRLTPAGEIMVNEARRLLEQVDITRDIIDQAKNSYVSQLRIGCYGNLLRNELPLALGAFRRAYLDTRVILSSGLRQKLYSELHEGKLDCLVSIRHEDAEDGRDWLQIRRICDEPVYAMLPLGHRLSGEEKVCMQQLSEDPMILFSGDENRQTVKRMISDGIPARVYAYAASQNCIETMVAAGYGISLGVKSAIRPHPGIIYKEVQDARRSSVCLMWAKGNANEDRIEALSSLLVMTRAE